MSDMGQDEIDKLLADALGGGGGGDDSADASSDAGAEADTGAQSQDDIDALFAQVQNGDADTGDDAGDSEPDEAPEDAMEGVASQDDIDALFAQMGQDEPADESPPPEPTADEAEPPAAPERETDEKAATHVDAGASQDDEGGPQGQDDIDALLAGMGGDEAEATQDAPVEEEPVVEESAGDASEQDDIDSLLAGMGGDDDAAEEAAVPDEPQESESEPEDEAAPESEPEPEPEEPEAAAEPAEQPEEPDASQDEEDDVFAQLTGGATDEAGGTDAVPPEDINYEDLLLERAQAEEAARIAEAEAAAAAESAAATEAKEPEHPPAPPEPSSQQIKSIAESLSLMGSSGEVENIAGQMASLLGQLSERARQYQNVWLSADQEVKDLRGKLGQAERRCGVQQSELTTLEEEVTDLRKRIATLEGQKLALEQSDQTKISALQMQVREQESRNQMLNTEVNALKEELDRARQESTGSDLESRRSRFEADRLRGEVDSERMERLRLQRALENREKEIQAMQAQSAGQASSLFLDELHRLVRRLESQLDARTAAAHEAMSVLDKLVVSDDMVPVESNLRAALQAAAGLDEDDSDALKQLSRDASTVRGSGEGDVKTPDTQKVDLVSFETAISSYDLDRANNLATALIRDGQATAARLTDKVYRCQALRRPEVAAHLDGVIKLLKSLRTIQEQADRRRGQEGADSNRLYVQMFDYLHNLVRLKLITRSTHEAWAFFLDMRGRFSFVTSDRQWADYRDGVLNA